MGPYINQICFFSFIYDYFNNFWTISFKNIFGSYSNKNPHCTGNRLFLDHEKAHFTILSGHLNKISRCKINTDRQ